MPTTTTPGELTCTFLLYCGFCAENMYMCACVGTASQNSSFKCSSSLCALMPAACACMFAASPAPEAPPQLPRVLASLLRTARWHLASLPQANALSARIKAALASTAHHPSHVHRALLGEPPSQLVQTQLMIANVSCKGLWQVAERMLVPLPSLFCAVHQRERGSQHLPLNVINADTCNAPSKCGVCCPPAMRTLHHRLCSRLGRCQLCGPLWWGRR
jgi:hypothetical protein